MSLSKSLSDEGDDSEFNRTNHLYCQDVLVNDPSPLCSSDSENNFSDTVQSNSFKFQSDIKKLKNIVGLLVNRVGKLEELVSAINESNTCTKISKNILRSYKKQKSAKIIKPEPKSRNMAECILCDNVDKIHEHIDFKKILIEINLRDTLMLNQYKIIKNFECLVCIFKTIDINDWKLHILSKSHLAVCHNTRDYLYSYVCETIMCKTLLYGSEVSLSIHMKRNHSKEFNINCISILMDEVMNHYISNEESQLYYCGHCNRLGYKPIHSEAEFLAITRSNYIEHYCKYCRVTFMCPPELLDSHALSVQHTTLKCIAIISEYLTDEYENYIQNLLANSFKLPYTVLSKYKQIDKQYGKCLSCCMEIDLNCLNLVLHLHECIYKSDITITNKTKFMKYACFVCANYSVDINDHISHITSYDHLTKCYDTINLYSYFCEPCCTYIYGHENDINDHRDLHNPLSPTEFPMFSTFMAKVFMDINSQFNKNEFVLYASNIEPNGSSTHTSFFCHACKVEFKSNYDFELHQITNEHIILVFTARVDKEKCLNGQFTLTTVSEIKPTKPVIQDSPSCSSWSMVNELLQKAGVNEEPIDINVNPTQLDDDGNSQVPLNKNEPPTEEIDRVEVPYEDRTYGNYVAERLKNIGSRYIKSNIKLKIDGIFYSEMKYSIE